METITSTEQLSLHTNRRIIYTTPVQEPSWPPTNWPSRGQRWRAPGLGVRSYGENGTPRRTRADQQDPKKASRGWRSRGPVSRPAPDDATRCCCAYWRRCCQVPRGLIGTDTSSFLRVSSAICLLKNENIIKSLGDSSRDVFSIERIE